MSVRFAAVAFVLALAACTGEARSARVPVDTAAVMPVMPPAAGDSAGVTAPVRANAGAVSAAAAPAMLAASDSAFGDALFHGKGRCFTCHGEHAKGAPKLGPDLTDSTWANAHGALSAIIDVVSNGAAASQRFPVAMPAFAGVLTDSETARVAAYVYALSHRGIVVPDSVLADSLRADSLRADSARADSARADSAHRPPPAPADTSRHSTP